MPKAPPRLPPKPLPHAYRVYANVRSFDAACPACGVITLVTPVGPKGVRTHKRTRAGKGYDPLSGVLKCRGCQRGWYVGLILWAMARGVRGRPADTVPTPEQAREIRELYGRGWGKTIEAGAEGVRARGSVNLVCWCGAECPAHPKGDEDVIE